MQLEFHHYIVLPNDQIPEADHQYYSIYYFDSHKINQDPINQFKHTNNWPKQKFNRNAAEISFTLLYKKNQQYLISDSLESP